MTGQAQSRQISDPILFEVFRNALTGLADEMGVVTLRTAQSPLIVSARDFSTALADADGRVMAQGNDMLIHLGTIPDAVRVLVQTFRRDIHPGDAFIFNAIDEVCQHLPDIYVIRPCFLAAELLGFAVCMAHHVDIGGRTPGGLAVDSTEIFQEGLQIPLVKLYDQGRLIQPIADLISRNVRLPNVLMGDIEGQLAACRVGEVGLARLAERYTAQGLRQLEAELYDYTEDLTRNEVRAIGDGTYEFEDWLDDDGVGGPPVPIRVKVAVSGSELVVDWTGSGDQVETAINCHITNTRAITYGALQGAFSDAIPSNEGFYRPIKVVARPGSIVNPMRGAALAQRGITASRMMDALLGALAKAVPDRIPAAGDGGIYSVTFWGATDEGAPFVSNDGILWAGWGGRPDQDGVEGAAPYYANNFAHPIEESERDGIVQILSIGFIPDTGGPGRWRGCLAVSKEIKVKVAKAVAFVRGPRRHFLPYGLAGGLSGAPSLLLLNPGESERVLPTTGLTTVTQGDVIRIVTAGGGGHGNPQDRALDSIVADVIDEKETPSHAAAAYAISLVSLMRRIRRDHEADGQLIPTLTITAEFDPERHLPESASAPKESRK